jgi:hypothetical protein
MWKALWKKWTIEKPVLFGDRLWDVFVVQLAAWLDRLTLRKMIAFIPVVILVLAYYHRIPLPPELMLVGDLLAYIDIFAVVFLLGMLGRVATILFVIRQVAARTATLAASLATATRRLDFRHRRARTGGKRKRLFGQPGKEDDGPSFASGIAWA